MGLQFIMGASGTGKSRTLYESIIRQSDKNKSKQYIVIVPEQFSLKIQQEFINLSPNKSIINIDVTTFLRFAYRIFDEIGKDERLILDDLGKTMVIRKIVEENKENLKIFGSNIRKTGVIEEIQSILSEFLQYNIDNEKIEEMILFSSKNSKGLLKSKLEDIKIIYNEFKIFIKDKFITNEEILDVLLDVIYKSNIIKNSVICFDGFTGFTPSQYKLIETFMKMAEEVYITVTIDKENSRQKIKNEFELFYLSKKFIYNIEDIASKNKVEVKKDIILDEFQRFKESKALLFLENNLFRYNNKYFKEYQNDINIISTKNAQEEIEFVADKIQQLVRKNNYRYHDFAIVTGDINIYYDIIQNKFEQLKIPYFIDEKRLIITNPFVEFIRSVVDLIVKDFSYESMFRYLRSSFLDYNNEDIDILENYVIAKGKKGIKAWRTYWNKKYNTKEDIDLEIINELRENIINSLENTIKVFKSRKSTVKDFTTQLYKFIVQNNISKKLDDYVNKFEQTNNLLLAKEYKQIYRIVMDTFDKIVELLGDEKISNKEYLEILESGLKEQEVGLIPFNLDQILIGDIERTRLNNIKVLFFIGVNDGIVPKLIDGSGVISDDEREFLINETKVELAPTERQNLYVEEFYLYLNMTKPQNKLYISYYNVGNDGETATPSYIIDRIKRLYRNLKVIVYKSGDNKDLEQILNSGISKKYIIDGLKNINKNIQNDTVWEQMLTEFMKLDEKGTLKYIDGVFYTNAENKIKKKIASQLYGETLLGDVTRLELFAKCAYAHFLKYGLSIEERAEFKIASIDIGNILHKTVEVFSVKAKSNEVIEINNNSLKCSWNMNDNDRDSIVENIAESVMNLYDIDMFYSSKRNEYMKKHIKRIAKRTIWAMSEHVNKGEFIPDEFEKVLSNNLQNSNIKYELDDNKYLKLTGKIDRIDLYKKDEDIYLKIIDYKSGKEKFDFQKFFYGLQLQLLFYMNVEKSLKEMEEKTDIIQAGAFYYHIDDPLIEKTLDYYDLTQEDKENIKAELLKAFKMDGIANENPNSILAMDKSLKKIESGDSFTKSDIIPIGIKRVDNNYYFSSESSVVSDEEISNISKFVKKKIIKEAKDIYNGEIQISPYLLGNENGCDYCKYREICGFDIRFSGNDFNKMKKLPKDDIMNRIKDKLRGDKENELD